MDVILLIIGYILAAFIAFNIGGNDAANPVDTAVGSGVLSLKEALLLFSIGVFIGSVLQGHSVIKTIGRGIIPSMTAIAAISAVIAGGAWILLATIKGMPVSTTQSITGGVIGVGLGMVLRNEIPFSQLSLGVLTNIFLSWLSSPLTAIFVSYALYRLTWRRLSRLEEAENGRKFIRIFMIASLLFSAYSFGANDVANATGVYLSVTSQYFGLPDSASMLILSVIGSLSIITGGWTIGRRVIETVAFKITKLDYKSGLTAEVSNALTVWLFTTLPSMLIGYGMPISTTHASVSSIIGVGIAKHKSVSSIDKSTIISIFTSWILTLPTTIIMGILTYLILSFVAGYI